MFATDILIITHDRNAFPRLHRNRMFNRIMDLSDFTVHILNAAVHSFGDHLQIIRGCGLKLEEQIQEQPNEVKVASLFEIQKSLVYYLTAITSMAGVISRLQEPLIAARLGFSLHSNEMLEDVAIEAAQCKKVAEIFAYKTNVLVSHFS